MCLSPLVIKCRPPLLMLGQNGAIPCKGTPPSFQTSMRGNAHLSQHHGYARHFPFHIAFPCIALATSRCTSALPLVCCLHRLLHLRLQSPFTRLMSAIACLTLFLLFSYITPQAIIKHTSELLRWSQSSCHISHSQTYSPHLRILLEHGPQRSHQVASHHTNPKPSA